MDDQQHEQGQNSAVVAKDVSQSESVSRSRRRLLWGAASTLPVILTLRSGAALAHSSNLISEADPANAMDADGNYLCMDKLSANGEPAPGIFDIGENRIHVQLIPNRTYYRSAGQNPDNLNNPIYGPQICEEGHGSYFYVGTGGQGQGQGQGQGNQMQQTQPVAAGALCSATHLTSFAGRIDLTEI